MDGEDGADARGLRAVENFFNSCRTEVEGGGVDVSEKWRGPGAKNGADRGEEAEGCGDDGMTGADAGCGQREPESVSTRGAADGVGHTQLDGSGFFKGGNGLAQNELLRLQHMPDRPHQFIVELAVLALEVQHWDRLGGWDRILRRVRCVFHTTMLPVSRLPECQKRERDARQHGFPGPKNGPLEYPNHVVSQVPKTGPGAPEGSR